MTGSLFLCTSWTFVEAIEYLGNEDTCFRIASILSFILSGIYFLVLYLLLIWQNEVISGDLDTTPKMTSTRGYAL